MYLSNWKVSVEKERVKFLGQAFIKGNNLLGPIAQSVKSLTADPGVASSIPARSNAFVEIGHEIISTVILLSADSRRVVVSYNGKYVHIKTTASIFFFIQEFSINPPL